jgi:nucleoside-diphosphate-sugar epimerase
MDTDRNRTVLITGGRGFIGRAVGKLLRREGYRVVSVDTSAREAGDDCESVREVVCDISDLSEVRRVFEEEAIGDIVHLAAILPTAAQREPVRATQVNIDGSVHLLEMARQFGVRRFVFGSSLSIYGTCAAERVVSEADPAAPEDLYGAAKLYVERLGQAYRDGHGMEFVSLRIGRVVGPGARSATSAWRSEIFEFLNARHAVEIALPYVAAERILLVHVEDVARMLVTLLRAPSPAHAVYNAVCESMVVADLKSEVEALNSNIKVRVGEGFAAGNPRLLDSDRFRQEFDFAMASIAEQLKRQRNKSSLAS